MGQTESTYQLLRRKYPELAKINDDLGEGLNIFWEDISHCTTLASQNKESQTWRRLLLRTLSASIEFFCNNINQSSLQLHDSGAASLLEEDYAFLLKNRDADAYKEKDKRLKFGRYFERTLTIYAKINHATFELKKGNEWNLFIGSIGTRNRITHPRKAADLRISESEYQSAYKGCLWATWCIKDLFGRLLPEKRQGAAGGPSGPPKDKDAG